MASYSVKGIIWLFTNKCGRSMNCRRNINYHLVTSDRVVSFGVTKHRVVYNSSDELQGN